MDFRLSAAIIAAKLTRFACRLIKRDGTNLPGRMALKIDPSVLKKLSKDYHTIMVTGTNGKTTTTRMISEIFNEAGRKHIINKSGANLLGGIVSVFVDAVDYRGRGICRLAVLEVDEATVNRLSEIINPDILVVTNFFRDQLDRYGELSTVVQKVRAGIGRFHDTKLILNADDALCVSLSRGTSNETVFFGVEPGAVPPASDRMVLTNSYCALCRGKYEYRYRVFGHLGGFYCPDCGFERPPAQMKCLKVKELKDIYSIFQFEIDGRIYTAKNAVPGLYNIYNAMAAITCCYHTGIPVEKAIDVLGRFESCFGRMESIPVGENKKIMLILAKNPAGFDQIINYLLLKDNLSNISFVINDNVQDGTDISWLWDVNFEKLGASGYKIGNVYASGTRAEDIALRLKYAGIQTEKMTLIKDFSQLIDTGIAAISSDETFFIVANYTAMMDLRRILKRRYHLKEMSA